MQYQHLIIDGYSLVFRRIGEQRTDRALLNRERERLIREMDRLHGSLAQKITLVFDGRQSSREYSGSGTRVEVIYSRAGQTADTVIERMVYDSPSPGGMAVVTSDRAILDVINAKGALGVSCGIFEDRLNAGRQHTNRKDLRSSGRPKRHTLGEFFPDVD